jgi:drug/metabolite transporter (DMT)-like permease
MSAGDTIRPRRRVPAGVALGCAGVLCFSGTAPATRVAAPVFGADLLTWSRILIAAVLGGFTLALTRRLRWPGRSLLPGLLAAGLGLAVGYPLFLGLAMQRAPAYQGAIVIGLAPAATAVLAALRAGERPRPAFWAACAIGLAAVLAFALSEGAGRMPANGWLVAAVLSVAIGYVEGARVSRSIGAAAALCWAMILLAPLALIGLVILLPVRDFNGLTPTAWFSLGYAGVASMFLGSVLWYQALAVGGTAAIGQLNLAQPFLAITWSALFLSEQLPWRVPAAAAVVLACMAVCINSRASDPQGASAPPVAKPRINHAPPPDR